MGNAKKAAVITIGTGLLVAGLVEIADSRAGAATVAPAAAVARPAAPALGRGVDLLASALHAEKVKGKWLVQGELRFKVYNVPQSGEFDMRLQEFRPRDDEWLTKGQATKKDLAITRAGEEFTMRRIYGCSGKLSWRIRLFAAPGRASDGTPTPPQEEFYPAKTGRQLKCED